MTLVLHRMNANKSLHLYHRSLKVAKLYQEKHPHIASTLRKNSREISEIFADIKDSNVVNGLHNLIENNLKTFKSLLANSSEEKLKILFKTFDSNDESLLPFHGSKDPPIDTDSHNDSSAQQIKILNNNEDGLEPAHVLSKDPSTNEEDFNSMTK